MIERGTRATVLVRDRGGTIRRCGAVLAILLLPLLLPSVVAQEAAPGDEVLAGPRPAGRVVDRLGILGQEATAAIGRVADGVQAGSGADMLVVVVSTTHGVSPREYASDIFRRWQLGSAERDDGLLLFVAIDDRKAEIILGDGVDAPAQEAASQRIMQEVMIPEFKRGRPGEAVLRGAFACAAEILGGPTEQPPDVGPGAAGDAPLMVPAAPPPAPWINPGPERPPSEGVPAFLLGTGLVGGAGASWWGIRRFLRYRKRPCPRCGLPLVQLGEAVDDAHLAAAERREEQLGSVDYDVWTCPDCPHVQKHRYGAFFTRFARCPKCRAVTKHDTVNRLRASTEWSEGLEEVNEKCLACDYQRSYQRRIPRESSSSMSSGSFSSGSSGGSSFSGGGSTSGRGASGSW